MENSEIVAGTGLLEGRIDALMAASADPTGDEVLILADYFDCDYKFFISNEALAAFEETDSLYRKHESYSARPIGVQYSNFSISANAKLGSGAPKSKDRTLFDSPREARTTKRTGCKPLRSCAFIWRMAKAKCLQMCSGIFVVLAFISSDAN